MCGGSSTTKRVPSQAEIAYLDGLVRGVYANHDLRPAIGWDGDSISQCHS